MQPEDSSPVRRSPFPIFDVLSILTFPILGSVIELKLAPAAFLFAKHIEIMKRTSGPLLERLGFVVDGARKENLALASLPQAVGQQ